MSKLEQRALAAATSVAATCGLTVDGAVTLASGSNVLVHLRPAPVVARVMTGTVVLHDDPERWLTRELAVLDFLAPSGLVVAPTGLIAPGPHHHDGLWMTFMEWVPHVTSAAIGDDARRLGRALRDLHDGLALFTGELGDLGDLRDDIERLLGELRAEDARGAEAIAGLRARLEALGAGVFASTLPVQALHGDVSLTNLFHTSRGLIWNDFEDTFRGPIHWDVAGLVASLRNRGANASVVRDVLDGYGWPDESQLTPFLAAHDLYNDIWQMYDEQRRRAHTLTG